MRGGLFSFIKTNQTTFDTNLTLKSEFHLFNEKVKENANVTIEAIEVFSKDKNTVIAVAVDSKDSHEYCGTFITLSLNNISYFLF
jgi:hypothetical protein